VLDIRLRSKVGKQELELKLGKILGPADYNVLLTGATRVRQPDGRLLCVYLPGALAGEVGAPGVYEVLHGLRTETSTNRGLASGTQRIASQQKRSYARSVPSTAVGALDPMGQMRYCRLTAWTGKNLPQWETLHPLLRAVAGHLERHVPDRYAAQLDYAHRSDPAWIVPGTPFSTITVNNTYPTGVHTDKGDLDAGFSTIACLRRGHYTGGQLVFPEYRVAVDMADGDLLLMDAHQWHGNVALICACGRQPNGYCKDCQAERISVVSYFRTKIADCGSPEEERQRGSAHHERLAAKRAHLPQPAAAPGPAPERAAPPL
jgi:hypothetical protein